MSASVHVLDRPPRTAAPRSARQSLARSVAHDSVWLVDVAALAACRAALFGHELPACRDGTQALLDVPPAYEQFCRSHFASVKRLHPELQWRDASFAYAVALSAHAMLCEALADEAEQRLAAQWTQVRGDCALDWREARSLVADGCSALARLDPLTVRR